MSSGRYTHQSQAAGTIVTASLYNRAHQNHLDNDVPTSAGAQSDNLTQFQATIDPAPAGVATPVADLGSELQQLRFVVADIKKTLNGGTPVAQWYTPIAPLATQVVAHGARVYRNTAQSISVKTTTACIFNTVRYDTGVVSPTFDPFWSAAYPTRLTASVAGLYQITGFLLWTTNNLVTGDIAVFIRLNGSKLLAAQERALPGTEAAPWQQVGCQYLLAKGDYVELVVFHTLTNPFNIINPEFGVELLGASAVTPPPVLYTLTVSTGGSGTGTVTWTPTNTGSTSPENFVAGTVVTLTANPTGGSFAGWSGDVPSGHEQDNPLMVTMDQARSLTATFQAYSAYYTVGGNGPAVALIILSTTNPYADLGSGQVTSGTIGNVQRRMPNSILVDRIEAELSPALTGSQAANIYLNRNGTDDPGIVLHFDSTSGTYAVATGSVTLNQDDLVAWHAALSGGLTSVALTHIVFRYRPVTATDGFVLGRQNYQTTGTGTDVANFAAAGGTNARTIIPVNTKVLNLTLVADSATGASTGTALALKQNDNLISGGGVTLSDPAVSVRGALNYTLDSTYNTNFQRTSVGSPATVNVRHMFSYQPVSPNTALSLFHTGRPLFNHTVGTGTVYLPIFGFATAGTPPSTETAARMRWPTKGKFKYFSALGFADVGTTVTVTLRINGADTGLVLTWTGNTTTVQSDLTTIVTVNPGDYVDLKVTRTSGTNTGFGFNGSIGFVSTT